MSIQIYLLFLLIILLIVLLIKYYLDSKHAIMNDKQNIIKNVNNNLTYNKILELTHKTKYKILELNYYVYKYSSVILKVFYNELNNLDKTTVALKSSNIIARALNFKTGYGGKRNKRITRKNIKHKSIKHKSRKHKRGTRKRQTS